MERASPRIFIPASSASASASRTSSRASSFRRDRPILGARAEAGAARSSVGDVAAASDRRCYGATSDARASTSASPPTGASSSPSATLGLDSSASSQRQGSSLSEQKPLMPARGRLRAETTPLLMRVHARRSGVLHRRSSSESSSDEGEDDEGRGRREGHEGNDLERGAEREAAAALKSQDGAARQQAREHRKAKRRRKRGAQLLRSRLCFIFVTLLLALCVYASFVEDFMGDVEIAITCGACLGVLAPLKALAQVGDDAFVDLFINICTTFGIEDEQVCRGAIAQQAPILAHDLRAISLASDTAREMCASVFGLCQYRDVRRRDVIAELGLPASPLPRVAQTRHSSAARPRKTFQIVHLSDVHVDREYKEGAESICTRPICCRAPDGHDGVASEVTKPAGKYGDKHCDTPDTLVQSMLGAINRIVPQSHFTLFTGDVVEAAVWLVDKPAVTTDLQQWYDELPGIVYPAFGNHDVAPVNAFARSESALVPGSFNSSQWVFDLAAQQWQQWIGKQAAQSVRDTYGCWARVHPGSRLKIISINTQYWYKQNFWLYDANEPFWDPNGVFSWLAHELHDAEKRGLRAWIIGHMPFGKPDALRTQSSYAYQIFHRYRHTIAAHFYGHSHVDEFEIGYSDYEDRRSDTAEQISFIAGAVTPQSGNPVFRVYDIDAETYEVWDFTTYIANRSEPSFKIDPDWRRYYSAREVYGPLLDPPLRGDEPLGPSFWHRVTEVMEKRDEIFQLFNTRLSRGGKVEPCRTAKCKRDTICMLRSMRSESNCAVLQVGLSFNDRKRDTDAVTEPNTGNGGEEADFYELRRHDLSCEGPGIGSMLRTFASDFFRGNDSFVLNMQLAAQQALQRHQTVSRLQR